MNVNCISCVSVENNVVKCGHSSMSKTPNVPVNFCGRCKLRTPITEDPPKTMRGLGDLVENGLSTIGITEAKVKSVANLFGIQDCGCSARKDYLNSIVPFGDDK